MSSDKQKIFLTIMLEVLGRPKEHLVDTLKQLIEKLGSEKGVIVKGSNINEPNEIENQKDLYTTFAEVDLEVDSVREIMIITFKYMPSHMDIVSPEKLSVDNKLLNETFNELTRRLHVYDEIARVIQNEKLILEKQVKELADKKSKGKSKKSPE